MHLIYEKTGKPVNAGDIAHTFRGGARCWSTGTAVT